MLSSLSTLIDRSFVIGFILPTIILTAVISLLFEDVAIVSKMTQAITAVDSFHAVFLPILALWLFAIILEMLNTPIFRVLEGYHWPLKNDNWKNKNVLDLQTLDRKIVKLKNDVQKSPVNSVLIQQYIEAVRRRAIMYPHDLGYVLPTQLGNVIRAFEQYPHAMYGADGIAIWPLLMNVISEEAKALVSRSRAYVDLLVNLCVMALALGVATFSLGLYETVTGYVDCLPETNCMYAAMKSNVTYIVYGALLIAASRLIYHFAIRFSISWGGSVKAAFDTHLAKLAKELVFELPSDPVKRVDFWREVTQQVLYSQPFNITAVSVNETKAGKDDAHATYILCETLPADLGTVVCDGGGSDGHPKIYLKLPQQFEPVVCGYCGKTFTSKSA